MNTKADGSANTATPGTGVDGWTTMNSTFDYYIAKAYIGDYAHFGSFIINGDWMISQKGEYWQNAQSHFTVSDFTQDFQVAFKPSDPTGTGDAGYPVFAPQFAVDAKTGKVYMQNAYVKGQIEATGGKFSGAMKVANTMTVGTYGSGNNSIRMLPSTANGAAIAGYVGTSQKFNLSFDSGKAKLSMGSGYYDDKTVWLIDANGAHAILAISGDGTPYVEINRNVDGTNKWIKISLSSGGLAKIGSNCWPTSRGDVEDGEVYSDLGTLKVRS